MLCFKDTTFCEESHRCANSECGRRFTDQDKADAIRWWGSDEFPIAWSDFKKDCGKFVANEQL